MEIETSDVNAIIAVGLSFLTFASGAKLVKEHLIAYIEANGGFPLTTTLPCGQGFVVKDAEALRNLPERDIPCSCGDPTHWFVRWKVDG